MRWNQLIPIFLGSRNNDIIGYMHVGSFDRNERMIQKMYLDCDSRKNLADANSRFRF